jgi:hypothetical protein
VARPTLFTNRKFLRLAQRLQSDALALGHLEFIWHAANETGNPVLGDADDVEALARWRGERGELVHALLEAGSNGAPGFIVPIENGARYEIHDYWHHAPDYVRKRWKREEQRREKGDEFRSNGATKRGAGTTDRTVTGQMTAHEASSDRTLTGQKGVFQDCQSGVDRTPAPAPAPNTEDKKPPTPLRTRGQGSLTRSGRKSRDIRAASNAAWAHVTDGASHTYRRKEIEAADPTLERAVARCGGWIRFGHSTAIGTLKAPFREAYEEILEAEDLEQPARAAEA